MITLRKMRGSNSPFRVKQRYLSKNQLRSTRASPVQSQTNQHGFRIPFKLVWTLASCCILIFLSGCGGGGGGTPDPNQPDDPVDPDDPSTPNIPNPTGLSFVQDTDAGFTRRIIGSSEAFTDPEFFAAGVAAGDYDLDGDTDLYIVGRDSDPNHLYQNQGDGTFEEVGSSLGVGVRHWGSGPAFGDMDGDGDLDLFVGSVVNNPIYLFENRLNEEEESFVDITPSSLLTIDAQHTISALFFDYDTDGFLDLFLTHWGANWAPGIDTEFIWRNNGDRTFSSVSIQAGVAYSSHERFDWSFTPNLTDIDGDGYADFLLASDFVTSEIYLYIGDGKYVRITDRNVIKDQSGMGAAVADFDNDGDMDWFVTSIYNQDVGFGNSFGNRLYRNLGGGFWEDATDESGTKNGDWGWGACAADFDQDGLIDLMMVNGWAEVGKDYNDRPIRFWRNLGNGMEFQEMGETVGMTNDGQGRGLACFDSDGDGDQDVVVVNNSEDHIIYYRNETDNENNYLIVELQGINTNRFGVGARITATTESGDQIRDIGGSNNFVSHNPLEAHFGLGTATSVDIHVRWPDLTTTELEGVAVNQTLSIQATETALRLTVVQGEGSGNYEEGDVIDVRSDPADNHYFFSHWSSSGGGSFGDEYSESTTFTMPTESVTITAHYIPGVGPDDNVSVARRWNELVLQSIRNDWARPTVHARNLFHTSAAMYDAWVAYSDHESTWLLGKSQNGVSCAWTDRITDEEADDVKEMRNEAISHAAYNIIRHRFHNSPRASRIRIDADALMGFLGLDKANESTDWESDDPAAIGNHIAGCYIDFGMTDGSNEENDYANLAYEPVNPALEPHLPGNPNIIDLNRWQPLALQTFVDQAGNPSTTNQPDFLSPEWGSVWPFSLKEEDLTIEERDGFSYWVYHDPGGPPLTGDTDTDDAYKWGFSLVATWSSHLDPADGVMWDISPETLGNIQSYPESSDYDSYNVFFDLLEGGDPSQGYETNPVTGEPYEPQIVPRGDYTRVLAEFWADGPDSETPPGHWFTILNTAVNDHPQLDRRLSGIGPVLDDLEWDVKAYFALGGTMHDVAIVAWGLKGWYDYIRPVSAIRAMADLGQSSEPDSANYNVGGIPLIEDYIELVAEGDELAGEENEHVDKIKVLAWRGPDYIEDPAEDVAGVGWILAENWWPYQRPTFVTPPFAGFVSGHSTYSRAAAEVLTAFTGSEYFPGGMSGFEITANEFLVFEQGPTVDMTLQWAKYYDASDQCSLSRIWGGIHPPADDIPGRLIGIVVGKNAFEHATLYFNGQVD